MMSASSCAVSGMCRVAAQFRNWFAILRFLIYAAQFRNCVNLQISWNIYMYNVVHNRNHLYLLSIVKENTKDRYVCVCVHKDTFLPTHKHGFQTKYDIRTRWWSVGIHPVYNIILKACLHWALMHTESHSMHIDCVCTANEKSQTRSNMRWANSLLEVDWKWIGMKC